MNCRHGEGEMLFSSGARYKGQWRNSDMCHGLLDFDEIKKTAPRKNMALEFARFQLYSLLNLIVKALWKPALSFQAQEASRRQAR